MRILMLILSSILLVCWSVGTGIAWANGYTDAVAAYNNKNYAKANQLFSSYLKMDPKNPDAVFYLGMGYAHLNQLEDARTAFDTVIQMTPANSPLAAKARNNITYLTQQQIIKASNSARASQIMTTSLSKSSKDNYLTYVIPNGKVVHFDSNRMPLKVFIGEAMGIPGWDGRKKQAVLAAMRNWQAATRGKVSFTQTWQEGNADIVVHWQKNFADNLLGVSPYQWVGNTLIRSDINLALYYPQGSQPIPFGELVTIATHEMGHAIGLKGHSPYPSDIMFFSSNHTANQALSMRDINTIGMLYRLDADIQNDGSTSAAQTKSYYDLYEQGLKAQTNNRPSDAIANYRKAIQLNGNLMEAKYNLGALLINEGNKMVHMNNLQGARRNFEEATRLFSDVLRNPKAPASAQENLSIARTNLNLVNGVLQQTR